VIVDAVPKRVSSLHASLLHWELLVATGNIEASDDLLRQLGTRYRDHSDVQQAFGDAAQRRGEFAEAAGHYARAIALGSRSGPLRYDYAVVRRRLGASESEIIPVLRDAVALDGQLYDPRYLLGYLLLKTGNREEGAEHLRIAARLRPSPATAQQALALAESKPDPPRELRRPQPSPPAPLPTVAGVLTQVDCLGDKARLHILSGGRKVFLLVADPSGVLLGNAGSAWTELPCGTVPRRAVFVSFRSRTDASYGTAGEVTAIRFDGQTR
jgi:tetratricopeptide (TPR) repeat protein